MEEIWKDIPEWEGIYQASTLGRIRSLDRFVYDIFKGAKRKRWMYGKILTPYFDTNTGYYGIKLTNGKRREQHCVHELIIKTFKPDKSDFRYCEGETNANLDKLEINHIDENKTNNNITNLEWCTKKYNLLYGNHMTNAIAIAKKRSKKVNMYDMNNNFIMQHESIRSASRYLNGDHSFIARVAGKEDKTAYGYKWKFVE